MKRVAAYVVLILVAFIFVSTAPLWQVDLPVRGDEVARVADRLMRADPHAPSIRTPILMGVDAYSDDCSQCHGPAYETWTPSEFRDCSPRDIYDVITWGHSVDHPDGMTYGGGPLELSNDHPACRFEPPGARWAVANYVYSSRLDPRHVEPRESWVAAWSQALNAIPPGGVLAESGPALFDRLCASCHGPTGYGNGPLALDVYPRPTDLSDTAWLASQSDAYLASVISQGTESGQGDGSADLVSGMPAWGAYLDEGSIDRLVMYIRSFGYSLEYPERLWNTRLRSVK